MTTYRKGEPGEEEYVFLLQHLADLLNRALNGEDVELGQRRRLGFFLNIYPLGGHLEECYCVSAGAPTSQVAAMLRALANTVESEIPKRDAIWGNSAKIVQ